MAGTDRRNKRCRWVSSWGGLCLLIGLSVMLVGCEDPEGTGVGKRARIISDKHDVNGVRIQETYQTEGRIVSRVQEVAGGDLFDFQVERLRELDAQVGANLDRLSRQYIQDVAVFTGLDPKELDILRPQIDNQTVSVDATILFPFIEARRARALNAQERAFIRRLDEQRRIDATHVRTRFADQVAAITGLPLPVVHGVLINGL